MLTIKLHYIISNDHKDIILSYMKNQNNVIRFLYNRLQQNSKLSQTELTSLSNSMNNIFIDSWFKQSALYKARELQKEEKVIFGGKKLFFERMKSKINKEEFKIKKLLPLFVIGESSRFGNRKFHFKIIEENKLVFMPERKTKIEIVLPKLRSNYKKMLFKLQQLVEQQKLSVTISIDLEFIYIMFDEGCLEQKVKKITNRIMSLDLNPNYIGYSIVDWTSKDSFKIIKTEIVSIKDLNDKQLNLKASSEDNRMKYLVNKRHFELYEISKYLVNVAKSCCVESFGIEDLSMESSDKGKGKRYNRLCNNLWNRGKLEQNLEKRLNIYGIKLCRMMPQYSSFIGNMMYREYPDMVAASIEINRRTFCFINKIKPVVFPDFKESLVTISKSLEEFKNSALSIDKLKDWKDFYIQVKNLRLRYRVSLENKYSKVFRLFHKNSLVNCLSVI